MPELGQSGAHLKILEITFLSCNNTYTVDARLSAVPDSRIRLFTDFSAEQIYTLFVENSPICSIFH